MAQNLLEASCTLPSLNNSVLKSPAGAEQESAVRVREGMGGHVDHSSSSVRRASLGKRGGHQMWETGYIVSTLEITEISCFTFEKESYMYRKEKSCNNPMLG